METGNEASGPSLRAPVPESLSTTLPGPCNHLPKQLAPMSTHFWEMWAPSLWYQKDAGLSRPVG